MHAQTSGKSLVDNKDRKKMPSDHAVAGHGVHTRGKLLPQQKHAPLQGAGVQPNGDPIELMLWGD